MDILVTTALIFFYLLIAFIINLLLKLYYGPFDCLMEARDLDLASCVWPVFLMAAILIGPFLIVGRVSSYIVSKIRKSNLERYKNGD